MYGYLSQSVYSLLSYLDVLSRYHFCYPIRMSWHIGFYAFKIFSMIIMISIQDIMGYPCISLFLQFKDIVKDIHVWISESTDILCYHILISFSDILYVIPFDYPDILVYIHSRYPQSYPTKTSCCIHKYPIFSKRISDLDILYVIPLSYPDLSLKRTSGPRATGTGPHVSLQPKIA
jgi:hypothetical protein